MTKQDLKELLTPEFLSTLHTAVECWGWSGDMTEAMDFCRWCYDMVELPTLNNCSPAMIPLSSKPEN